MIDASPESDCHSRSMLACQNGDTLYVDMFLRTSRGSRKVIVIVLAGFALGTMQTCSVYTPRQARSYITWRPSLEFRRKCSSQRGLVCAQSQSRGLHWQDPKLSLCFACLAAAATVAEPALALAIREEPSNALSLPTWAIHISSVVEW